MTALGLSEDGVNFCDRYALNAGGEFRRRPSKTQRLKSKGLLPLGVFK
jgi:hypothetical protein